MVGAFLKAFFNDSITVAMIGQILAAIGQPFILGSPGKIASNWFRKDRVCYIKIILESICNNNRCFSKYNRNYFRIYSSNNIL